MRCLSGIKPTGNLHIGNYFGAVRQYVELQKSYEGFYFIADYHALNTYPKPDDLRTLTLDILTSYLALGLDPERSVIFLQSEIPEVTELSMLFMNVTPMALLQRAHAYKDQVSKGVNINMGLFTYPVLMASDILIYDSDIVPVGQDQKQHVEIARDIAVKFNELYGDVFKLPEPRIIESVAVVPGTDGQKMSKSYDNTIDIFAPENELKKQVMGIVTDSTPLEAPKDPDKCNVFAIYKLFATPEQTEDLRKRYLAGNFGYGTAKKELLALILEHFKPYREKKLELKNDPAYVTKVLKEGSHKARAVAIEKVKQCKQVMGLIGNVY